MGETVFIGFGSNVGDRIDHCDRAVQLFQLLPFSSPTGVSSLYETEPVLDVGDPGPGWFVNGVLRMETELPARRLLETCLEIERALGRDRETRGGPRTLDLDLLFYGQHVLDEPDLQIPHPRLHLRRFALAPLAELAPDWWHPVREQTVTTLLAQLTDRAQVRRLTVAPSVASGARPACAPRPSAS